MNPVITTLSRKRFLAGWRLAWLGLAVLLGATPTAFAQAEKSEPLTREEFARFLEEYQRFTAESAALKAENESLRVEVDDLKAEVAALRERIGPVDVQRLIADERNILLKKVRDEAEHRGLPLLPGRSNFTLGGFFSTGFENRRQSDSTFTAEVAPILLWKPTDKLLFEGRFDIFLADRKTEVDLAYAQLSYQLNDYVTVGGGKFVLPFGIFWERARAPWINKLPLMPLLYEKGFMGEAGVGLQLRGGAAIGRSKINYAAYAMNGPELRTNPSDLGRLGFGRGRDLNNNKTFGGRIGFLPIPEMEIGSSFMVGRVGESGTVFAKADTQVLGFDFTYAREFDALKGRLDIRSEFVKVDTDDAQFAAFFDPFNFENERDGWYVQAAYRPMLSKAMIFEGIELKDFEFVLRYDQVQEPGPGRLGVDRKRLTLGLDYWMLPSVVLKAAYVFDEASGGPDEDGFFLGMSAGF